ncbi:hypothetical protein DACRYDRAFT_105551 [Dacryopinax primogenitus]|uniref:Uncharacterized protein n=1 Tax=Dacryopinax primogenitus (strain DJM 731) TaxID=1858805 RepID=M5G2P0_DACPD|nr:uncharacterized protein DACRYDRAFT_105551 [Dacryopinax primogenitus]EJU04491.1 hypothetical protein DACRYDRAFT_105551 [Dacryopinax primogenitus]
MEPKTEDARLSAIIDMLNEVATVWRLQQAAMSLWPSMQQAQEWAKISWDYVVQAVAKRGEVIPAAVCGSTMYIDMIAVTDPAVFHDLLLEKTAQVLLSKYGGVFTRDKAHIAKWIAGLC